MIKNIVFDMGDVLVHYDAKRVCRQFMKNPEEIEEVFRAVFISPEWILLDMGVISEEEALRRIGRRLNGDHLRRMAETCLAHWHEYNMWPAEGMAELVRSLKDRGFGLYICSNASMRLPECYRQVIPGVEWFDGVLFSAEIRYIKPQREMYLELFRRFDLKPKECFFIDDVEVNIQGAKDCGMNGYCFGDGDMDRLKARLDSLPGPA